MNPNTLLRARLCCVCALLLPALAVRLAAQAAPKPAEEVVRMEEFKVTSMIGTYAETTSSAVAKIPLDLRDLAQAVQVLNTNFLGDLRALTMDDVYPYIVGLACESNQNTSFQLRGMSMGTGNSAISTQVDGLPGTSSRYGSPTTANVERVEVLRGPTSVMYGQANPGGLLNMVTKKPKEIRQGLLSVGVATFAGHTSDFGSDVSFINMLDVTGPIDAGKKWLIASSSRRTTRVPTAATSRATRSTSTPCSPTAGAPRPS
jgi:iron complex outermembrane receptor protein